MRILGAIAAMAAALAPGSLNPSPTTLGLGYICGAERPRAGPAAPKLVISEGMGSGGLVARAGTPEAQAWLNYGLKLYHAFYHDDAKAAFAKAVSLDPNCSLCAWGQSLGLGRTMNYDIPEAETATALAAAQRAASLARTPMERDLAAAMVRRYAAGEDGDAREARYARDMVALAGRYGREPDLRDLAGHALVTVGGDGDNTAALAVLRPALARNPNDTAAIHYLIHASDSYARMAETLPYALRLAELAPAASHLNHMAAHTLFRLGRYEEVAVVNAKAMEVDTDYAHAMGQGGAPGTPRYYAHNMAFGVAGAMMAGDRDLSLKYADHTPVAFPAGAEPFRRAFTSAKTMIAYGRYAPDKALGLAAPPAADPPFTRIVWRYTRGEAQAAKGDAAGVLAEMKALEAVAVEPGGGIPELKLVAAKVLAGRAAMIQGDPARAASLYAEAVKAQDTFEGGFDPPAWWYPVRRSVAAARLQMGDHRGAAAEARRSLAEWPGDGLALRVLSEAEARSGDRRAAARHAAEARKVWQANVDAVPLGLI